jgi:hypothetical protein
MVNALSWTALGLSGAALLYALARAANSGCRFLPAPLRPFAAAAAIALLAGALLTLPTRKPWSPGQTLAPGLLLGGGLVLLAAGWVRGGREEERENGGVGASAQVAAAALGISILLVIYPARLLDAVTGYGIGALAAGLILAGGARKRAPWLAGGEEEESEVASAAEWTAVVAAALATATYLAALHRSAPGVREWQPLPALFMAALAVALTARDTLRPAPGRAALYTLAAVLIPMAVVAWLIGYRLHGGAPSGPAFLRVVGVGAAIYALVAWLEATGGSGADGPSGHPASRGARSRALLAALLALGAAAFGFRALHGYGAGLAALAGLAVAMALPASPALPAGGRPLLMGALVVGLLPALYRIFSERNEHRGGLEPDFFYYYAALVLGALLPALLAGAATGLVRGRRLRERESEDSGVMVSAPAAAALARVTLAGLLAAAAPLAVWLLVGERPQAAFMVGLPVGIALLAAAGADERQRQGGRDGERERPLACLLALAMACSAAQLTHLLEPLAMRTRLERVGILAAVGVLALAGVAATFFWERRGGDGRKT